jgi:very-short-patch-repair endonuclease
VRHISRPYDIKPAAPSPDVVIAELAERQYGVVSRAQLQAAGISDQMIRTRLDRRQLYRVRRGAYSVTKRPTELGLFIAAVLACGTHALLSHRSAGALWDLLRDRDPIDVLLPCRARSQAGLKVRTTRSLHPADVASHQDIPCTSVARTIVDLGGVLRRDELSRVLERSMVLRLFDRHAIEAALDRGNGRGGTGTLRRLLGRLDDEVPLTRSELERRFLQLVRDALLPTPITNGQVNGYEVDFHWPDAKLIVETDGHATHATPFAFHRDRDRDLDLRLAGWEVMRITWRQLRDEPERIVALLRAKLGGL